MPEPVELSSRIEHVDFKDKNNVSLNEKSLDLDIEAFNERLCENRDISSLSLAEPAIKYNAGNAMSNKIPYFFETPVPKYFRETGWFKNENAFKFVCWAFSRCSSQSHKVILDNKEVLLEPFEFVAGRLTCSEECFLSEKQFRGQLFSMIESGLLKKGANSKANRYSTYIWVTSAFSKYEGQQKVQQRANSGPTHGHNQEEKNIRYKEKDHHPNPSSEKVIDDSLQKEKIHVCLDVYMDQEDLDECIKIKGSLENVKDCIEKIQKSPGKNKNIQISNWARTLNVWKLNNSVADKIIENENLAKKFIDENEENAGCQFRIYHDRAKDIRGLLFQGLGATSQPEFIIFTDLEFKEKLKKTIKDKKIKKKGVVDLNTQNL